MDAGEAHTAIEQMKTDGVHRFDPVRFRFIEAMLRRAAQQQEPVSRLVAERAGAAMDDYREAFEQARSRAAELLARLCSTRPECAEEAGALFEAAQYRELERLARRELRRGRQAPLAALTERIINGPGDEDLPPGPTSMEELLRRQEEEILLSFSADDDQELPTPRATAPELKSVRQFRGTMARLNADKLVRQAVGEAPPDCGPLNPQMLAIRSLTAMSELSPHYLSRFVSYIDTLFWLEQAADQAES
jgi:hypothetical protein